MKGLNESFTKEYISQLESVSFEISRKMQNAGFSGIRKSNAKGSSMEFSDFREYTPGDDFRRIDWNGYARNGKLFVKLFMEERQASIHLFVDMSKSMEGEKCWYSKMLALSLAYVSLNHMDKVNLFLFSGGIIDRKINIQSKRSISDIIQFLDNSTLGGETDFSKMISECKKLSFGPGVSVIFSDFFTQTSAVEELIKHLKYQKQEVILLHVLSKEEREPDIKGPVRLVDTETKTQKNLDITKPVMEQYKKALFAFQNELNEISRKRGAKFIDCYTDTPLLKTFYRLL